MNCLNLVYYYDMRFLLVMALTLGSTIKVDKNTLREEWIRFSRVYMKVDLILLAVGNIWVNGHFFKIKYEKLHIIWTSCGQYVHLRQHCDKKIDMQNEIHVNQNDQSRKTIQQDLNMAFEASNDHATRSHAPARPTVHNGASTCSSTYLHATERWSSPSNSLSCSNNPGSETTFGPGGDNINHGVINLSVFEVAVIV